MDERINRLRNLLTEKDLDALLVSGSTNIFYLTGLAHFPLNERDAHILVSQSKLYIFTDARYTRAIEKSHPYLEIVEAGARSNFYEKLNNIVRHEQWRRVGYEASILTVAEFAKIKKIIKTEQSDKVSFIAADPLLLSLRIKKDTFEVKAIQKACNLTDAAFTHILPFFKKGVTEADIAQEIEFYIKKNGGELAFPSIIAFGANSAVPHHHTGNTKLTRKGTPILMDFGAKADGYNADMTRTIFYGSPSSSLEQQYKAVQFVQTKALEALKKAAKSSKKVFLKEVDNEAREALKKTGYPPLPHALGHGVGIDVHESPVISPLSSDYAETDMVVTVEPGIYIPGTAGVRIEDTVLIQSDDIKTLTSSSKSIIIL